MTGVLETETISCRARSPRFSVEFQSTRSACVLTMHGELSWLSVAALEAQIDRLGCSPLSDLVLDLSHLDGIDGTGVRVLVGLQDYARGREGTFSCFGAKEAVARALEGTPLDPAR